jgi:MoxR-like ATPase
VVTTRAQMPGRVMVVSVLAPRMSQVSYIVSHVDNFDVIQALARTALTGGNESAAHQVERLATRLAEAGEDREAKSLRLLVSKSRRSQAVEPVNMEMSGTTNETAVVQLQALGVKTALPVDKDSGAPLCEVVFPGRHGALPLVDSNTRLAIDSLLDEWNQRAKLASAGLPTSSSLLLFGPPGTGKTSLALHLASVLDTPAVVARLDGLMSSLLGNTARNLAALFDFCNRYNTVLILDEFDAVAKVRDDPNEVGEVKRVVNALLQNLDRRVGRGLSIGITNHEQLLDSAIWRRFEHQIHLGMPSSEIRLAIATSYLKPLAAAAPLAKTITWATEGQSGADVRTLSLAAMKQIVLSETDRKLIDSFRAAANSSGPRIQTRVREALEEPDPKLAQLLSAAEVRVGSSELGELFMRDRRTIARWIGDNEDSDQGGE